MTWSRLVACHARQRSDKQQGLSARVHVCTLSGDDPTVAEGATPLAWATGRVLIRLPLPSNPRPSDDHSDVLRARVTVCMHRASGASLQVRSRNACKICNAMTSCTHHQQRVHPPPAAGAPTTNSGCKVTLPTNGWLHIAVRLRRAVELDADASKAA